MARRSFRQKELEEYLKRLEEAKKRDHRKLGQELDLFSIQDLAGPGLIFFHPKGGMIRKELEDWMRERVHQARVLACVYAARGARRFVEDLGSLRFLRRKHVQADGAGRCGIPAQADELPVPYPDLSRSQAKSYRELPVRLGELGTVYRYERSGVMHGLLRVRGFTQDDAHIFCTPEQAEDEVVNCLQFAIDTLKTFGFTEYEAELSTWDNGVSGKYDGTADQWQHAESALKKAVDRLGLKAPVAAGRSRVLWPEDRRETRRCNRPEMAAFHGAVRLHASSAVRSRIYCRGW